MSTLVLTSLNPYANMDHQLRCFNEWRTVGYKVRSHNSDVECAQLAKHGLKTDQLKKIPILDTAESLFGKPIPRILPILERALQSDHDHFILTNSDIFPAHRKVISDYLAKSFESVAFTRTECFDLTLSRFNPQTYYRGGLDLFWFSQSGLQHVVKRLKSSLAADRMTFGVPGWDFFLGHLLCRELGSPIIDGPIFLHRSHKVSYWHIDALGYYLREMNKNGVYTAQDPTSLGIEFSEFIEQQCKHNVRISRLLKLVFYKTPTPHKIPDFTVPEKRSENQEILRVFSKFLSSVNVACAFSDSELEVFTARQRDDKDWAIAVSLLRHQDKRFSNWIRHLQLLLISLLCTEYKYLKTLTLDYPEGNLHSVALKQTVANEHGRSRDLSIFNLLASEMVTYGVLNLNLMKYIFTATAHSDEKALFTIIISICKQGLRNA